MGQCKKNLLLYHLDCILTDHRWSLTYIYIVARIQYNNVDLSPVTTFQTSELTMKCASVRTYSKKLEN